MGTPRDYETLMVQKKAKDTFRRAKKLLEDDMKIELSHSQALILMAQRIEIEYFDLLPSSKSGGNDDKEEVVGEKGTE